ncbi:MULTISPECIES: hypothetical protein [unclassified Pseudomonas]|uniref:hypothetical protein n=1 Tax=unclassified Pseudomonas TaxID=196821 RepID=UPI000A1F2145|nr:MULTISPECIES: hypothetical protein [unclassified Pseudomonas]
MYPGNFTAQMEMVLGPSYRQYPDVGIVDSLNPRLDGWLCTDTHEHYRPMRFLFTYLGEDESGINYRITAAVGWEYAGAMLRESMNGWIGMQGFAIGRLVDYVATARPFGSDPIWRIKKLTDWDGDFNTLNTVEFQLLNSDGHAMSVRAYTHSAKFRKGTPGRSHSFIYFYAEDEDRYEPARFRLVHSKRA